MTSATHHPIACRVCASDQGVLLFEVDGRQVLRCAVCSHVYLNDEHTHETIADLYENYGQQGENQYFAGMDAQVMANIDGYLRTSRALLTLEAERAPRLLDIGCGTGGLMERAQALGFRVEGVEICQPLAELTRARLGCKVHDRFLTELELPEASYDVITMYDLVEHLADPVGDLCAVHRLLKPGGVLFVLTPNDEALVRRISKALFHLSLGRFDRPMRKLYYPDHLSYFTAQSLTELFARTGFEVLEGYTKNQELGRLEISWLEKALVRGVFVLGDRLPRAGGKHIAYARKQPAQA